MGLLLDKGPDYVKADLYDVLVYYIRTSKQSAKGCGFTLLLRLWVDEEACTKPKSVTLDAFTESHRIGRCCRTGRSEREES